MPAPGNQHLSNPSAMSVNPYDESSKPPISQYTAQEIATLQSRLEKKLGPEYLSSRSGPGGSKVHYISANICIALANEVFGFNGWSSSIREVTVDFVDEHAQTGKVSLGLSVIVRVTLKDGTFHEDIGYGQIENCRGKAAAFEKAKKEGTTDALKRALRNFGNVLGNCLYDKAYLNRVTKMKAEPLVGWDESGLHRHAEYVPAGSVAAGNGVVKKETNGGKVVAAMNGSSSRISEPPTVPTLTTADSFEDLLGEFDEADFNVVDDEHPDMVALPAVNDKITPQQPTMQPPSRPMGRSMSGGPQPQQRQPQTPLNRPGRSGPPNQHNTSQNQNSTGNGAPRHHTPPPQKPANGPDIPEIVGFFSAKAVNKLAGPAEIDETKLPAAPLNGQTFNPHAESPSIRKTAGVDHTKSKPLSRTGQHVAPAAEEEGAAAAVISQAAASAASTNGRGAGGPPNAPGGFGPPPQRGPGMMNPQLNQTRRIGAPGGPGSPLANRGQYRPPTMKRPMGGAEGGGTGASAPGNVAGNTATRPALTELSANGSGTVVHGNGPGDGPQDVKRQKVV